jgi:DNA-binding transcriptional ArsR family regulator
VRKITPQTHTQNHQQPILDSLQELKNEIKTLRNDLNRLEGSILKERIKATEAALTENRILHYANQLEDELNEDLPLLTNPQCDKHNQCSQHFTTLTTENLSVIKTAKTKEALADLDTKIERVGEVIEKAKGTPCEICHQKLQKKLKRQKRALQTIVLVETTVDGQTSEELNISRLVDSVLEPLANHARLKILMSTYEGKKSFSKLSQITGLKGGHLIFHLKKLLDAGLLAQEDNKGDYVVTGRGLDVVKKIFILQP